MTLMVSLNAFWRTWVEQARSSGSVEMAVWKVSGIRSGCNLISMCRLLGSALFLINNLLLPPGNFEWWPHPELLRYLLFSTTADTRVKLPPLSNSQVWVNTESKKGVLKIGKKPDSRIFDLCNKWKHWIAPLISNLLFCILKEY